MTTTAVIRTPLRCRGATQQTLKWRERAATSACAVRSISRRHYWILKELTREAGCLVTWRGQWQFRGRAGAAGDELLGGLERCRLLKSENEVTDIGVIRNIGKYFFCGVSDSSFKMLRLLKWLCWRVFNPRLINLFNLRQSTEITQFGFSYVLLFMIII